MSKSLSWIIPHSVAILAAFLAGPLLGRMNWVQHFSIPLTTITGQDAWRLVTDVLALTFILAFAVIAYERLSDDGRGWSFLRVMLFPTAALLATMFLGRTFRTYGFSLVENMGAYNFFRGYALALVASGIWITVLWIRHLELLRNAIAPPPVKQRSIRKGVQEVPPLTDSSDEIPAQPAEKVSTPVLNGQPPSVLGRYKILKELGRGAMGLVYLGKDPTIQRFVAIKTMRLDEIDDQDKLQEVKARFFREAESAGRLSHPNIVTIYDAGEQGDLGYIAMELIEGRSLKEWSRPPHLMSVADVVHNLAAVADALDYAHQQGVIHRDIKPANIMITKERLVKVMDFGIAKMVSSSKTQTEVVLGTPTYMSPEQIAGKKVDGRSDIFSLGIVLFELLAGRPPFMADNLSALLFAIAHNPHPDILTLRQDLPPMLQEVVTRALQKELVQRYRRASEFSQDLRACLRSLAA